MNSNALPQESALLDRFPMGVVVLDENARICYMNDRAFGYLGAESADLLTQGIEDIVHNEAFSECLRHVRSRTAETQSLQIHKDGRFYSYALSSVDESPALGRRVMVVIEDVTRLKTVDSITGEFLSTILHRLRGPLTTLKTSLGMLSSQSPEAASAAYLEVVDMSRHEVDRLSAFVADLRSAFVVDAGLAEKELEFEEINAAQIVKRSLADLSRSCAECRDGATRVTVSGHETAVLRGDFEKVKQVLHHLFKNALIFSGNAPVCVTIARDGSGVRIEVIDRGIGIPERDLPYVFDKFFRGDNEITRTVDGNGLGLYIARALAALMGGSLYCENAVDQGTVFVLTLPAGGGA